MSLFSQEQMWQRRRLLAEAAAASSSVTDREGGKNHEGDDPTAILWFIFIALAIGTACRSAFTFVNSPVPYTVALLVRTLVVAMMRIISALRLTFRTLFLTTRNTNTFLFLLSFPTSFLF